MGVFLPDSGADDPTPMVSEIDVANRQDDLPEALVVGRCPEQRRAADEAVPAPRVLSHAELNDDFAVWFSDAGSDLLLRSAHSVCGRHLYEDIAFEAAGNIYRQWGDPRKRHLFKTQSGYVFQLVRNTFLSYRRKAANRPELHQELPGEEDTAFWHRIGEDPGCEVRQALLLLDQEMAEIVFMRYFLNLTLSATAREMGLQRSEAEKIHNQALDTLRQILGPEEEAG
jgi:DNA-directed RNA polymerase specialized sigma24 family protein